MSKFNLELIRKAVKPRELLAHYGAKQIRGTGEIRSTCPLHQGDNPTAFVFNEHKQVWCCHTGDCHGGDIFDFVMIAEDCTFVEAVHKLAELFNIPLEGVSTSDIEALELSYRDEAFKFIELMRKRTKKTELPEYTFHGKLKRLNSYRGFSPEAIEHWKLRACVEGELAGRVVMPIEDSERRLVGVTGRKYKPELSAKWMHRPRNLHTGWVLTGLGRNLKEIKARGEAIVVEGIFDCVRLWDSGLKNCCTPIGTFFTDTHEKELFKAGVTKLILGFDNDEAGRKATKKIIKKLAHKFDLSILNLPESKDPCDCSKEEIWKAYRSRLKPHEWLARYG